MNRLIVPFILAGMVTTTAAAHHPDRATQPVHQRIDVIGPVGNRLPPSYRRVYNRPTDIGGKIAYWIAPSSQEAMAWHRAKHMRAYKRDLPRQLPLYFYPKPWESLQIGPRPAPEAAEISARTTTYGGQTDSAAELEAVELDGETLPMPQPLYDPLMLPEDG